MAQESEAVIREVARDVWTFSRCVVDAVPITVHRPDIAIVYVFVSVEHMKPIQPRSYRRRGTLDRDQARERPHMAPRVYPADAGYTG